MKTDWRLSRRAFLAATAAGAGTVMLAACGQAATSSPSPSASTPSSAKPAGSAAKPAASGAAASGASGAATTAAPADWKKQWDSMVAGAQKEGKLILATGSSPDARVQVPAAFKKAFNVDVEYLGGSSSELATRLRGEQSAGQYTVDVSIAGANTAYITFYGEHMVEPVKPHLINPEVLDASKWTSGKGVWYMDPGQEYYVRIANYVSPNVVANTDSLKPDIKSWQDLLKPEYKGKITALDPLVPGSGGQTSAYLNKTLGDDWTRKFYVDQQPGITRDDRQLADWVGHGKYPIGVGIRTEELVKLMKDGFKVPVIDPLDGAPGYTSAGFGILGLFKNPPHPNAAHLFLNWILTKDGQIAWNQAWKTPGIRTDIDNHWAPEFIVPKQGVDYFDAYDWDYASTGWQEINGKIKKLLSGVSVTG